MKLLKSVLYHHDVWRCGLINDTCTQAEYLFTIYNLTSMLLPANVRIVMCCKVLCTKGLCEILI